MSIWIDDKYVNLISARLPRFKRKNKNLYNFRCPICGDSERSKTKARGWIFEKSNKLRFYCHNCNASMLIGTFIKQLDPSMFLDYQREKFIENNISNPLVEPKPDITKTTAPKFMSGDSPLKKLKKISALSVDHPFKKYVMSRKIPSHHHYRLFYCPSFKKWVNSFIPNKFDEADDSPRLIIPLIDREKKFFGCQGRSLTDKKVKYITVLIDETKPKIFGLDTCNMTKDFYVFEGAIDSLFFDNAIAMCGSDLNWKSIDVDKSKATIVFDNEPRSIQIVRKIEKYIDNGYKVCLWPASITGKDVNEMILNGHDPEELKIVVDKNTFNGLEAKLNIQMWRKC